MATTIEGTARLKRQMKVFPAVARDEIAKALEKGAQEVVDLAKSLVPVELGDLRESIGWTWGQAPRGSVAITVIGGHGSNLRITIYAGDERAFYARWVEFGTAPHNVARKGGTVAGKREAREGGGKPHPGARPNPFFFPAYRAFRKRARSRISRAINKAAKRAAASGGQ